MKPQGSMMGNLAKLSFKGLGIKLPLDWSQPTGEAGQQYNDSFQPGELSTAPDPARIFAPASVNKYHTDAAKTVGKQLEDYMDGICKAICSAIGNWMSMCAFTGVIINGPTGVVAPGNVQGPPLGPLILAAGPPMATPQEMKYTNAIANALSTAWQTWHMGLAGTLMWPPSLACFPGPLHPPVPNIPLPVAALSSPGESMLSKATLSGMMMGQYGGPTDNHAKDLFDSVADAFNKTFTMWKPATMVQNVLCSVAPVPTFAPPVVPVGPVVAGTGMGMANLQ